MGSTAALAVLCIASSVLCQFAAGYAPRPCSQGLPMGGAMRLEVSCTADSGVEVAWSPAPGGEDDVDLLQIEYTCRDMFDSNDVTMTDILLPNSQRISSAGLVPETSGRDIECTISGCYEDSWFASYAIPPVFHTCLNSPQPDTGVHIEPTNDEDLSSISSTSSPSIQPSSSSFLSTSHSTSSTVSPQASISVPPPPTSIPMDAPYAALDDTWKLRISAFSSASVVPTSTLEFSSLPGIVTAAEDQGAFTGTAAVYDDMASTGLFLAAPSTTTLGTTTVLAVTAAQLGSSQTLHPTPLTPVLPQTRTTNEVTTKSNSDLETAVHVTALVIMVGLVLMAGASLVLTLAFLWHCYVKAEQRRNVSCNDVMKEREKPARNTCQHFILIA